VRRKNKKTGKEVLQFPRKKVEPKDENKQCKYAQHYTRKKANWERPGPRSVGDVLPTRKGRGRKDSSRRILNSRNHKRILRQGSGGSQGRRRRRGQNNVKKRERGLKRGKMGRKEKGDWLLDLRFQRQNGEGTTKDFADALRSKKSKEPTYGRAVAKVGETASTSRTYDVQLGWGCNLAWDRGGE